MSIHSHAFGRITLTGADAKKFRNQVTYGRPNAAAKATVAEGVKHSKEFAEKGSISLKLKG